MKRKENWLITNKLKEKSFEWKSACLWNFILFFFIHSSGFFFNNHCDWTTRAHSVYDFIHGGIRLFEHVCLLISIYLKMTKNYMYIRSSRNATPCTCLYSICIKSETSIDQKRNTYMTCGDNKHCSKSKALRKIQNKSWSNTVL